MALFEEPRNNYRFSKKDKEEILRVYEEVKRGFSYSVAPGMVIQEVCNRMNIKRASLYKILKKNAENGLPMPSGSAKTGPKENVAYTRHKPYSASDKDGVVSAFSYVERKFPTFSNAERVREVMDITNAKRSTAYHILQNRALPQVSARKPGPAKGTPRTDDLSKYPANNIFLRDRLRHVMHDDFFRPNKIPSLERIMKQILHYPELANLSRATVYRMLRKMGFKYQKCNRNSSLIDRKDII